LSFLHLSFYTRVPGLAKDMSFSALIPSTWVGPPYHENGENCLINTITVINVSITYKLVFDVSCCLFDGNNFMATFSLRLPSLFVCLSTHLRMLLLFSLLFLFWFVSSLSALSSSSRRSFVSSLSTLIVFLFCWNNNYTVQQLRQRMPNVGCIGICSEATTRH